MEQTNISGETSADKSIGRSGLDGSSWILQDRSPGLANNVSMVFLKVFNLLSHTE
jgi:hypothetical protein